MKRLIIAALALTATACVQSSPPPQEEQVQQQREQQQSQRLAQNQTNPELNWILIGISTSKYNEQISTAVFKTYGECEQAQKEEVNSCIPMQELPDSYWR